MQGARFARLGDNMREVAVTEGDKVAAQIQFGFAVNATALRSRQVMNQSQTPRWTSDKGIHEQYRVRARLKRAERNTARCAKARASELGLRAFSQAGAIQGLTKTLKTCTGFRNCPVSRCNVSWRRLRISAEGDWKTCALLRA